MYLGVLTSAGGAGPCLSNYFAVIEYHDQGNLRMKTYLDFFDSRGISNIWFYCRIMVAGAESRELTFSYFKQEAESKNVKWHETPHPTTSKFRKHDIQAKDH